MGRKGKEAKGGSGKREREGGEQRPGKEDEGNKAKRRRSEASQEPDTPTSSRPARERKSVVRYSASWEKASPATIKAVSVQKGRGVPLKDIPNVAYRLSKRKIDDDLMKLHIILFGKRSSKYFVKRNLSLFSGYVWTENVEKQRAKAKERIDKCFKERLYNFCELLDIPVSKSCNKEELSAKVLHFLEFPRPTTQISLAEKEQKRKKSERATMGNIATSAGEAAADSLFQKRKKSNKGSVKKGQNSDPRVQEPVESTEEYSGEPAGFLGVSEREHNAVTEENDVGEGQSEELEKQGERDEGRGQSEEKQMGHGEKRKNSANKKVMGSQAKTKDKTTAVKKITASKSFKGLSKSSVEKDVSSDKDDKAQDDKSDHPKNGSSQEEEGDTGHPKAQSTEEEEESKELLDGKSVSSKKSVKNLAARKGKAAPVEKDLPKSAEKRGAEVSTRPAASKSIKKGRSVEKASGKKSTSIPKTPASKSSNKQIKSLAKISTKKQSGKMIRMAEKEPSRKQMLDTVADILKEVDFNSVTLSDIFKKLEDIFQVDLSSKRHVVKSVIEEAINNMTDEEEDSEEDGEEKNQEIGVDVRKSDGKSEVDSEE